MKFNYFSWYTKSECFFVCIFLLDRFIGPAGGTVFSTFSIFLFLLLFGTFKPLPFEFFISTAQNSVIFSEFVSSL